MRVLIAEDDHKLSRLLERGLTESGMRVSIVHRGDEALATLRVDPVDVAVLDVMLPGMDGFATCEQMRAERIWTPVLMLTARAAIEDRVRGLEAVPTTISKPFSFDELDSRLRALARRGPVERPVLEAGDLRMRSRRCARGVEPPSSSSRGRSACFWRRSSATGADPRS